MGYFLAGGVGVGHVGWGVSGVALGDEDNSLTKPNLFLFGDKCRTVQNSKELSSPCSIQLDGSF